MRRAVSTLIAVLALVAVAVFTSSCGNSGVDRKIRKVMTTVYSMNITTDDHPWKMVQGIYAYGKGFIIIDPLTQEKLQALNHLSLGAVGGLVRTDREGPFFTGMAGDRECEKHRNQFLSQVIEPGADFQTGFASDRGNMQDTILFVRRALRTLDPAELAESTDVKTGPDGNELGWTLLLLANTGHILAKWQNEKGQVVSTEDVLRVALSRPPEWGSYGGLIENMGVAAALRSYKLYRLKEETSFYEADKAAAKKENKPFDEPKPAYDSLPLDGSWLDADKRVEEVVDILKRNRNDDGTFSAGCLTKKASAADTAESVLYTGLALDFIVQALYGKQLDEKWVSDSVNVLADDIIENQYELVEEFTALTHSVHALRKYTDLRNRDTAPAAPVTERAFESDREPPGCCD